MTWYLWALLSMISGSLEEVIDKVVIIKKPEKIDALVATFYRNAGFFFFTVLAGILGIFGKMSFVWNINFLILALLWPLNSLSYDYFLRNVELSRFQGVFYTFPLLFLFVDSAFFNASYAPLQIVGVILLVLGACIFSFDGKRKKSVFSWKGIFWMLVKVGAYAYLLILFKHLGNSVNEISFYFSIWLLVIAAYAVLIVTTGKYKKLKETARTERFWAKTFASKGFDFLSGIFYLEALSLATLTHVSAFTSFTPLVLIIILLTLSLFSKVNVAEDFSRQTLPYKIAATIILTLGGILMFI